MAVSDILTGQFVRIKQTPATVADRLVARFIDSLAIAAYFIGFMYFLSSVSVYARGSQGASEVMYILVVLFFSLPTWMYTFLCESLFGGQTLGKYVMKIRVVMADGSRPTVGALFLRWLLELVDIYMGCVGLVFIIASKKGQRLGDLAAGTMVIRRPDPSTMHFSLADYHYLTPGYQPAYPEARNLSLRQAELIRRTVDSVMALPHPYATPRLEELACKVERAIGTQRRHDTLSFLRTVADDYQYYAMQVV